MTEHARRRLDLVDGKAWVAFAIDGQPPEDEHGGPTRVSTLSVFSGPVSLPATMTELALLTCGFCARWFPPFLDASRSFAGRMRDE